MKPFVFIFTVLLSITAFSQSSFGNKKNTAPVVLTASSFEKGMYSGFDNLLKGQPFLNGWEFDSLILHIRDAVYCKSDISWRNASYDDKDPFYPCNRSEDQLKKTLSESGKMQLDSVWGFNDGHFIYCRIADNFYPLVSIGRYSVVNFYKSYKPNAITYPDYEKIDNQINSPYLDAQDYARKEFAKDLNYPAPGLYGNKSKQFLLSMETGSILKFSEETLKEIFKKDTALYEEYMDAKHSQEINLLYLAKFNQKYPFEF